MRGQKQIKTLTIGNPHVANELVASLSHASETGLFYCYYRSVHSLPA